jgi:hypothetical protein
VRGRIPGQKYGGVSSYVNRNHFAGFFGHGQTVSLKSLNIQGYRFFDIGYSLVAAVALAMATRQTGTTGAPIPIFISIHDHLSHAASFLCEKVYHETPNQNRASGPIRI